MKKTKTTSKRPKSIRINGREWRISYDPDRAGGTFQTYDNDGVGHMVIGTRWKSAECLTQILMHEIVEGILTDRGLRFSAGDDIHFKFVFDHDNLEQIVVSLMDAMKSVGLLNENWAGGEDTKV